MYTKNLDVGKIAPHHFPPLLKLIYFLGVKKTLTPFKRRYKPYLFLTT